MRDGARNWAKENRGRAYAVGMLSDVLPILGGGAVVLDIFVDGGVGSLGVIAAAGGSNAAAGVLAKGFEELGMRRMKTGAGAVERRLSSIYELI